MTTLATVFHYQQQPVRTISLRGEPWFVAADICAILGLDTSLTVNGRQRGGVRRSGLDADEKDTALVSTPNGRKEMFIISEPGLYHLMLNRRKPEARAVCRWLCHEVLPALRRPQGLAAPLAETDKPRQAAAATFSLGEVAKLLAIPGLGRNNLVKFLRAEGILMANNVAKQRYVERGYFQIVLAAAIAPDGTTRVKPVTRVREPGVAFILRKLEAYLLMYRETENANL